MCNNMARCNLRVIFPFPFFLNCKRRGLFFFPPCEIFYFGSRKYSKYSFRVVKHVIPLAFWSMQLVWAKWIHTFHCALNLISCHHHRNPFLHMLLFHQNMWFRKVCPLASCNMTWKKSLLFFLTQSILHLLCTFVLHFLCEVGYTWTYTWSKWNTMAWIFSEIVVIYILPLGL